MESKTVSHFQILVWKNILKVRNGHRELPRGPAVKSLPANTWDTNSIPGPGRSHNCWAHVPWSPCSTTRDAAAVRSSAPQQVSLHSLHLEDTCAQPQRPSAAKNKKGKGCELSSLLAIALQWMLPCLPPAVPGSFWRSTCQVLEGGGPWLWEAGVLWLGEGLMLQGLLRAHLAKSKQPPVC